MYNFNIVGTFELALKLKWVVFGWLNWQANESRVKWYTVPLYKVLGMFLEEYM